MNEFLNNLKNQAEQNPMLALGVGAAALTALTRFLSTSIDAANARAWTKEVARRSLKDTAKL